MIMERLPEPLDVLVINDVFTYSEVKNMLLEIGGLEFSDNIAKISSSNPSEIDTNLGRFFSSEVLDALVEVNSLYHTYFSINDHRTEIRSYEAGNDEFELTQSEGVFTAMTLLSNDNEVEDIATVMVQVGEITAYEVRVHNNTTLIFPSSYLRAVKANVDLFVASTNFYVIPN